MISAIVPAKQESTTIGRLVSTVARYCDEVIVVLSRDDLATLAQVPELAKIVYEDKAGKGIALRTGAEASRGEILVFIDADLSHNPADIPQLVKPILNNDADLVVASRMLGGSSELFYEFSQFVRLCGSHIITLCINYKFKARLTDSQNGFRAITRELYFGLELHERHTTIEQEMTVNALRYGARVLEIPAHEYSRAAGISKIKIFKHGWRYLLLLFKYLILRAPRLKYTDDKSTISRKYNVPWYSAD